MTTLHVNIPDALRAKLQLRASEQGHSTVEQYVEALLQEDAELLDVGSPDHVSFSSASQLAEKLREGLASGESREIGADEWEQMEKAMISKHRNRA